MRRVLQGANHRQPIIGFLNSASKANSYQLDITQREDESRVRQPNTACVLGIFRRLSKAFKQVWSRGRATREATSRDWTEENQFDPWKAIRLVTRRVAR